MRKLFLGLTFFITAFVLGYVTAHFYLPRLFESNPTADTALPASIPEPPVPASVDAPIATTIPSTSDQLETIDEVNDMNVDVPPKYPVKLLEIGEGYPDEQAKIKNGQKWLALFPENGDYVLRWTKIKVSYPDAVESDDDPYLWQQVRVSGEMQPVFMVRNAPILHAGTVVTVFRGLDEAWSSKLFENGIDVSGSFTTLSNGFYKNFCIGEESSIVAVQETQNREGKRVLALFLIKDDNRQVLFTDEGSYNRDLGQLYWVGDLDQDGKVDIYCRLADGTNALFLSSQAEKGKLVKRVARFYWDVGC
jgi:hypothetical protein